MILLIAVTFMGCSLFGKGGGGDSVDTTWDETFGTGGIATYAFNSGENMSKIQKRADMTVDSQGRIYFAGASGSGVLTLVRFTAEGAIDTDPDLE